MEIVDGWMVAVSASETKGCETSDGSQLMPKPEAPKSTVSVVGRTLVSMPPPKGSKFAGWLVM